MKKFLQTHIKDILILAFVIVIIIYLFIKKDYKPQTYKEQAIERLNLDSLKLKIYEEVKDSLLDADTLYMRKLSLMPAKERIQEFNKFFPK